MVISGQNKDWLAWFCQQAAGCRCMKELEDEGATGLWRCLLPPIPDNTPCLWPRQYSVTADHWWAVAIATAQAPFQGPPWSHKPQSLTRSCCPTERLHLVPGRALQSMLQVLFSASPQHVLMAAMLPVAAFLVTSSCSRHVWLWPACALRLGVASLFSFFPLLFHCTTKWQPWDPQVVAAAQACMQGCWRIGEADEDF